MSLKNPNFPSSAFFDEIQAALDSSEAVHNDATKHGNAVFAFVITNAAGETDTWHVDFRETGRVRKGPGNNPTVIFSLSEEEFGDMVANKVSAENLFAAGKLRIKDDVVKATTVGPIIKGPRKCRL